MSYMIRRISRRLLQLPIGYELKDLVRTCQRLDVKRNLSSMASDQKEDTSPTIEDEAVAQNVDTQAAAADKEEITKLNDSLAEMKDKYQRSLAENENVRKRLRKEVSDSKRYAVQGFCKDLLTVADILSTAVDTAPKEILQKSDDDKRWSDFYDGVKLTKQELMSVFKRHGLVQFTPEKGDKFDPNIHEAMFQAPVPDLKPGLVAHVQTAGYLLHERTLRPAQVGVSK